MYIFIVICLLIRGGMGAKSIAHISECSAGFFAWIPLFILCMIVIGFMVATYVLRLHQWRVAEGYEFLPDDTMWTPKRMLKFMLLAIGAGTCSGTLGAGGGTTMGPLLLFLGVNGTVTSATGAVLVFYTSSIASLTYAMSGRTPEDYGGLIIAMCVFSGFAGVTFVNWLVKKYNRLYIVTAVMTIVLALATCAIVIYGITSTVHKSQLGLLTAKINDLCKA